jgi:2-polyprenyl-3-methyl-5-hydroxy-6-metoxy-1,4-benzoquinol methylase
MTSIATSLPHPDGDVVILHHPDGSKFIEVSPKDPRTFVPIKTCRTTYSLALIETILRVKGLAWLCDEIRRDEDRDYVERPLLKELNAYFPTGYFSRKRILDFGCGSAASTIILARNFPDAEIVGVELYPELLQIAEGRKEHHGQANVDLCRSPSGSQLPDNIGEFDIVVMSAVYEHLLPEERRTITEQLWRAIRPGGALFIDQAPNRMFPIELHTTGLLFINYLPDPVAYSFARRFSKRIDPNSSWESLLRQGIRGTTVSEIIGNIPVENGEPVLLEPDKTGMTDRVDLWYSNTNEARLRWLKRSARFVIKALHRLTGTAMIPDLAIAIEKKSHR